MDPTGVELDKSKQLGLAVMIALAFMILGVIIWIIAKKGTEVFGF